jgi:hypothetical protein
MQGELNIFKANLLRIKTQYNLKEPKEKFIGFVWFIIPKILMEIKLISVKTIKIN